MLKFLAVLMVFSLLNISIVKADTQQWIELSRSSNGHVTWYDPNEKKYMHTFESQGNVYRSTQMVNAKVVGSAGVPSASTVSANVTQTVAKRSVVNGVMQNAIKYGRYAKNAGTFVASRANVYLFAATLIADALSKDDDSKPLPPDKVPFYSPKRDEYVQAGKGNWACLAIAARGEDCLERGKVMLMPDTLTLENERYNGKMLCYSSSKSNRLVENYQFSHFEYDLTRENFPWDGGRCYVFMKHKTLDLISRFENGDVEFGSGYYELPIDLSKYEEKLIREADKNPTAWVGVSVDDNDNIPDITPPNVVVSGEQVAQTPPYTDETGKAVQTRFNFQTSGDANGGLGKTKVTETTIPRPDLTPNSPEAPKPNSPTNPNSPANPNNSDNKKPQDEQGLCDKYPNILACEKMGKVEEGVFDEIKIPSITDETTWSEDNFLPSDGVCPAPKVFYVSGKQFSLSYEPLCKFMGMVRFIILFAFILASAYLTFGSLRKD